MFRIAFACNKQMQSTITTKVIVPHLIWAEQTNLFDRGRSVPGASLDANIPNVPQVYVKSHNISLLTFFKHICGLYLFIGTFAKILAEKSGSEASSLISVLLVFNLLTVKSSAANCLFIGKRIWIWSICKLAKLVSGDVPQMVTSSLLLLVGRPCGVGCKVKCNKDGRYNLHKVTVYPLLNICCFRFPAFLLDF